MKRIILLSFLIIKNTLVAQKTDTVTYSIVNLQKVIGENKKWQTSPNVFGYYYYYNDRGRGEVVNSKVNIDNTGRIEKIQSSGLDYYKVPFISTFSKQQDSLVFAYNNNITKYIDKGQNIPFYNVPCGKEILIKALLQLPERKTKSLGDDSICIKELVKHNIKFENKTLTFYLCALLEGKGNDGEDYTWLDENFNYFANVGDWSKVIKKGYETLTDTLFAIQEKQAAPFYQTIFNQLSDTLPDAFAVKNVNVFDAPNAKILLDYTVIIKKGAITHLGKSNKIMIPKDYKIIDGKNKTLLPGLWDTHSHYNKGDGINYLSGGVTHVRDMGNMPDIKLIQENILNHKMIGPEINYLSGFIDKDDEYHGPVGKLVNSQSEALTAIRQFKKAGYNQMKIYSSIDTSWVKKMCAEAHLLKMRVAGHVPYHLTASRAIDMGYDEITHINMILLNFFPDTIDTRKNRFRPVGQNAYKIDLNSQAVKDLILKMKMKKTVVEPTVNVFNSMFNNFPGDTTAEYQPIMNWLPADTRKNMVIKSFIDDTTKIPEYKKSFATILKMIKLMYDNGITLLTGTDGVTQLGLQHELELLVQAGIPANEVLKMATYNAPKVFGLSEKYGEIKTNRVADFILIDGDPTNNMSDIRKVFMVVNNHKLFYPKKLYKNNGWSYYYE
jgi:Amidohydrolase family